MKPALPSASRPSRWRHLLTGLLFAGLVGGAAACSSFASPTEERMSFGQMQSLNRGVSGAWILREYPYAKEVVSDPRSRQPRLLRYLVEDPAGDTQTLVLHFDGQGILERKAYSGPILRPPLDDDDTAPPPARDPAAP